MKLERSGVLLTGAAGGIGRATALALGRRDARLCLVDLAAERLEAVAREVAAAGGSADILVADLSRGDELARVAGEARERLGRVDVLVNNAGLSPFGALDEQDPSFLETLFAVNLVAPVLLCRHLLPAMLEQGGGRIVNVGSIFGSLGFPYFAAYSASKAGVRGFSEALRRELAGTPVSVTYFAPRATRTPASDAYADMAAAVKMHMDEPEAVADALVDAIESDRRERLVGGPERTFVRINALMPRVVDLALRGTRGRMAPFARGTNGAS